MGQRTPKEADELASAYLRREISATLNQLFNELSLKVGNLEITYEAGILEGVRASIRKLREKGLIE